MQHEQIIIIGAGGFGRECYEWLAHMQGKETPVIKGFLSNRPTDLDAFSLPHNIIGDPDSYIPQKGDQFILAIGHTTHRARIARALKAKGAQFFNLIHPTATVSRYARYGQGLIACPYSTVSMNATLGENVMLNVYAYAAHDCTIGDYSVLSPYATAAGWAKLGEEVFMAIQSAVLPECSIGDRAKISIQKAALESVPADTIVR